MPDQPLTDPHEKREMDERWDAVGRRHKVFGFGGVILTLAVIGLGVLAWYAYPELKRHEATLKSLPSVQQLVDGMSDRLKDVNSKLSEWAKDKQTLSDRLAKLGQHTETQLQAVRKQVEEASAETMRRVETQIQDKVQAVDARLERLESARNGDQTRVADLQRELDQVRGELAKTADQLSA